MNYEEDMYLPKLLELHFIMNHFQISDNNHLRYIVMNVYIIHEIKIIMKVANYNYTLKKFLKSEIDRKLLDR